MAQYNDDVRINKALENKINEVFDDTRFADAIYDLLSHKKIVYNNSIIWDKYKWDYPIKIGNTLYVKQTFGCVKTNDILTIE